MACGVCGSAGHNRRTHAEHDEPQPDALPTVGDFPEGFRSHFGLAPRSDNGLLIPRPGVVAERGTVDPSESGEPFTLSMDVEYNPAGLEQFMVGRTSFVVGDEEDPPTSHGPDAGQSVSTRAEADLVPPWRTVLGPDEPIRITLPGVYVLDANEYHDPTITGDWLSNSDARQLIDDGCPAQFRYDRDNGIRKTSAAFSMGHAVHAAILGKGETIAVRPAEWSDWRKQAARDWRAEQEAAGRSVILPEDAAIVEAMAAAVHQHERAHELLSQPGRPEVALFWVDPSTGVQRRALVDYLPDSPDTNGVMRVVDLKSADEVAPNDKMERKLYDHAWHRQATTIADGVVALGLAAEVDFHFIVQSKKAPHLVTVVRLDSDAERIGGIENRRAIDVYKRCVETGIWPGFADDTVTMTVPGWIANRYQDELEVI